MVGLVGGGGLVVGVLAGCGSADAEEAPVESRTFPLTGKTLTIDSKNSAIDVVPADVKDVRVTRRVDGWVFLGSGPDTSWRMADGKLTLRVDCDAVASDCEARHSVKVPRDVTVRVENDNGGVTASGFTTPLRIASDNGGVTVRDTTGPLDLRSDNGAVTTEDVAARTVKAESDNGSVRVGLRAGFLPERVEAVSDNGDVRIGLPRAGAPYAVKATSGNGSVQVGVPQDDGSRRVVTARSDNGDVRVRTAE
ncbi:DUF4097 family beta strand repeat-containing protein [Streptomyces sp. NPDC055078]